MITFRKAKLEDADQLGYVHYVSWIETYKGLISDSYLNQRSPEKSAKMFERTHCEHIFLAEENQVVVGFINYNSSTEEDLNSYGAIYALYVLKAHQGFGIGKKLLDFAIDYFMNEGFKGISLWVLDSNHQAISFYEHVGFIYDGKMKEQVLGDVVTEIRMIKKLI